VQNLNNKGRVYGFGSKGLVMKQQSRRSTSTRSSSVNNYGAHKMAIRLNKSIAKAAEDAPQEELGRKIEAEVTQKLTNQFTKHLAKKETALEKMFKKQLKKSQLNVDRIWNFFTRQQAGTSSTQPPGSSPFEEETDEDEEDETPNLGDDSHV